MSSFQPRSLFVSAQYAQGIGIGVTNGFSSLVMPSDWNILTGLRHAEHWGLRSSTSLTVCCLRCLGAGETHSFWDFAVVDFPRCAMCIDNLSLFELVYLSVAGGVKCAHPVPARGARAYLCPEAVSHRRECVVRHL